MLTFPVSVYPHYEDILLAAGMQVPIGGRAKRGFKLRLLPFIGTGTADAFIYSEASRKGAVRIPITASKHGVQPPSQSDLLALLGCSLPLLRLKSTSGRFCCTWLSCFGALSYFDKGVASDF